MFLLKLSPTDLFIFIFFVFTPTLAPPKQIQLGRDHSCWSGGPCTIHFGQWFPMCHSLLHSGGSLPPCAPVNPRKPCILSFFSPCVQAAWAIGRHHVQEDYATRGAFPNPTVQRGRCPLPPPSGSPVLKTVEACQDPGVGADPFLPNPSQTDTQMWNTPSIYWAMSGTE